MIFANSGDIASGEGIAVDVIFKTQLSITLSRQLPAIPSGGRIEMVHAIHRLLQSRLRLHHPVARPAAGGGARLLTILRTDAEGPNGCASALCIRSVRLRA